MNGYYDTGVILKLYTEESMSEQARAFVTGRGQALYLSCLHTAEFTSALRLKEFRGESKSSQVARCLAGLREDFDSGVLKPLPVEWDAAWETCRTLSDSFASETGCRTMDALHVACAILAAAELFISADRRQLALAEQAGLRTVNPLRRP